LDYSNPEIPEGINVTKTHPLKEFFLLSLGVFGVIIALILALSFFADKLSHYIPYSIEANASFGVFTTTNADTPLQQYLQTLADKIVIAQQLPEEMNIKVHVVNQDSVNAFATLGGHVMFFQGLLEKVPNENALAMVMAHEIAHIKHRHPIRSLGRGIVLGLVASIFSASLGNDLLGQYAGNAGLLSQLQFSREHEKQADATALLAMQQIYGHVNGANDLFKLLQQEQGTVYQPEFFNTHPAIESRMQRINDLQLKSNTENTELNQLPPDYAGWLKQLSSETPRTDQQKISTEN